MRRALALMLLLVPACSPFALITLGADGYAGYDAYARATKPPDRVFAVPRDGVRFHKIVYADDPRISLWCSDNAYAKWAAAHADLCASASVASSQPTQHRSRR